MSASPEITWLWEDPKGDFCSLFDKSPFGLAQCERPGKITARNSALERLLGIRLSLGQPHQLADLIPAPERGEAARQISELFDGKRDSIQIDSQTIGVNRRPVRWTAWRISASNGNPGSVLALAEELSQSPDSAQRLQ